MRGKEKKKGRGEKEILSMRWIMQSAILESTKNEGEASWK
jgi:hypothetical protein